MTEKKLILEKAAKKIKGLDTTRLDRVIDLCAEKCANKKRLSGEPFFFHPLAIAEIVLDITPDQNMLLAALLHKIPDRSKSFWERCKEDFGEEACEMVKRIDRINAIRIPGEKGQVEILREMFLAMAKDIRVVIIKLAERLHDLQTYTALPPHDREELANETLSIFAPLAGRLGIFHLKAPLEDLSFEILEPEKYREIKIKLEKGEQERDQAITEAKKILEEILKKNGITAQIFGRTKHIWSIAQKMKKKGHDHLEDIYDIFALRAVVSNVKECYQSLGIIHEYFTPLPRRFKDYIAVPKANGYQSLHTTVAGLGSKHFPVEIQIRSEKMDEEAEYGVAAHWHYKEKGSQKRISQESGAKKWIDGLLEMEEQLRENEDFSGESFSERIFAVTPNGDIKDLPIGSTPIDFAFAIHSDVGLRLKVAKINGRVVPLGRKIENGDVIEIITARDATPNQNWLSSCASNRAKNHLRAFFRKKDDTTLLREGKILLGKALARFGLPELDQNLSVLNLYLKKKRTKKEREELLVRVGNGSMSPVVIVKNLLEKDHSQGSRKAIEKKTETPEKKEEKIIIEGSENLPTKIASCCHPQTGDEIAGFVTRGNHVTIHRADCKTFKKLNPARLVEAHFEGKKLPNRAIVETNRIVKDRKGLLRDVVSIFAEENINVVEVSFPEQSEFHGKMRFVVEYENFEQIDQAIERIEEIPEIERVTRVEERILI